MLSADDLTERRLGVKIEHELVSKSQNNETVESATTTSLTKLTAVEVVGV